MAKKKTKTNLKRTVRKSGKSSIVEIMTTNAEGASCYEITDPAERLIATIGTCMNEPKFYPTDPGTQVVGYQYDSSDFDEQAKLVVNTAFEVAESESPKDLVQIAHWARKELKMRTLPQVLMAIAAHCNETKQYVRKYTPKVVQRADELKQIFIAERSLFGHNKSLPNSLKRGLADAFTKFKEYDFLKYEGQHRPHFGDILKMIDRKKNYPLNDSLDHYLKTGEIKDEKAIPRIAARKKLAQCKTFGPQAKKLAKKAGVTWEVLSSQFGGSKEVWEYLIETEALGYMAMMRNMRNILQAGVSEDHLMTVAEKIKNGAVNSRQLPFRFLMAKIMLEKECRQNQGVNILIKALFEAVQKLTEAGHSVPGITFTIVDSSGSMSAPVSDKSQMTCIGAGAMLAGMLHASSAKGSIIGHFASNWKRLEGIDGMSALQIAERIVRAQGQCGYGTDLEQVLNWAIRNKVKFDRMVVMSDCQTYGNNYGRYGQEGNIAGLWKRYKKEVNPNAVLHTIDLMGRGQSMTKQGDDSVNLVNGFSEKLLDTIFRFEGINLETGVQEKEKKEFTLEYVRENF